MTWTMYDSITAADIPAGAEGVAGYVGGQWKWAPADWDRFPRARKVTIAVHADQDADALDVEWGDATPEQAPDWIRRQQARGLAWPSIYCSLNLWSTVRGACAGLSYDSWIADYGKPGTPGYGRPHMIPGAAATQYADPAAGSGGHYDLSLCQDWWPRSQGGNMTPEEHQKLDEIWNFLFYGSDSRVPGDSAIHSGLAAANAKLDALKLAPSDPKAVAELVISALGAGLAKAVTDELAKRLQSQAA